MTTKERIAGQPWCDEELYKHLAKPKKKLEAQEALAKFIARLEEIRVECEIPDVVVACTCPVLVADDGTTPIASPVTLLSLGDSTVAAELGSIVFRKYTLPTIKRAEALRASAAGEEVLEDDDNDSSD